MVVDVERAIVRNVDGEGVAGAGGTAEVKVPAGGGSGSCAARAAGLRLQSRATSRPFDARWASSVMASCPFRSEAIGLAGDWHRGAGVARGPPGVQQCG